jgi:hypothetical protein
LAKEATEEKAVDDMGKNIKSEVCHGSKSLFDGPQKIENGRQGRG